MSAPSRRPGSWRVHRAESMSPGRLCISAISARSSNHPPANVRSRHHPATFSCVACISDTARNYRHLRRSMPSPGVSCRCNRWRRRRHLSRPADPGRGFLHVTPGTRVPRRNSRPRPTWRPRPRADPAAQALAVRIPRSRTRAHGVAARWPNGGLHPIDHLRRPSLAAGSSFRIRPKSGTRTYKTPWTPAVSTATTSSIRCRARRHLHRPLRPRGRRGHRCIRSTPSTFPTSIRCIRYIIRHRGTAGTISRPEYRR